MLKFAQTDDSNFLSRVKRHPIAAGASALGAAGLASDAVCLGKMLVNGTPPIVALPLTGIGSLVHGAILRSGYKHMYPESSVRDLTVADRKLIARELGKD